MRKFLLLMMLLSSFALVGCGANKVAVLDPAKLYQDSSAGKAGLVYLESVEQEVRAKAEAAQKIAETMPNNPDLPVALQTFFADCQEVMNKAQQDAVSAVQDLVKKTIDEYRAKENISIVLESEIAVSADQQSDITNKIIEMMNKSTVQFAPVMVKDFVAPAQSTKSNKK